MVKRSRVLLYVVMGAGLVVSLGAFALLPKWRRTQYTNNQDSIGGVLILGLILAFSPMVLGAILPSPSRWAPDAMNRYFESLRTEVLIELIETATELDIQQRNSP